MNDGYERCEKKRNVKMNVMMMMMMRTQHLNLCRCGKKIHNGPKTTCWATKPINIFNVGTLLHFSHFCFFIVFLMADTRHKAVIQLYFNTS